MSNDNRDYRNDRENRDNRDRRDDRDDRFRRDDRDHRDDHRDDRDRRDCRKFREEFDVIVRAHLDQRRDLPFEVIVKRTVFDCDLLISSDERIFHGRMDYNFNNFDNHEYGGFAVRGEEKVAVKITNAPRDLDLDERCEHKIGYESYSNRSLRPIVVAEFVNFFHQY